MMAMNSEPAMKEYFFYSYFNILNWFRVIEWE